MKDKKCNIISTLLIIIGAVAAVAGIAYVVYRFFIHDDFDDFDEDIYFDDDDLEEWLEDEDDEDDDDDEEADDDDPENQDDDEGDDDDDDEGDKDLGKGAQKRIRQLVEQKNTAQSRVKDLEKQLEEAKKLSGDDGRALLAAAEATGILPGLMTKDEAKAIKDLGEIPKVLNHYEDWLDDHDKDDELDIGNGSTMSFSDVKKRVRNLRTQLEDLKNRYGDRRKELMAKVRGIFETGLAAQKAGWKPGGKKTPAKKNERKKLHDKPTGKNKPSAKPGKKANWGDVDGEDSFIRAIAASNKE